LTSWGTVSFWRVTALWSWFGSLPDWCLLHAVGCACGEWRGVAICGERSVAYNLHDSLVPVNARDFPSPIRNSRSATKSAGISWPLSDTDMTTQRTYY
jgi:hypothetical protein